MEQATAQPMLQTSDIVIIVTALFLGFCALIAPYVAEWMKRKCFAPRLRIEFSHKHPYCHKTIWGDGSPVYCFRFRVVNNGNSLARFCEAILEELWIANSSGKFIKYENFSPVNLIWTGQYEYRKTEKGLISIPKKLIDINPKRKVFCDIGRISHPKIAEESVFYSEKNSKKLKFFFEITDRFFAQPDCISPGKAKIKISIYSENAPKCEKYLHIEWSGKWEDQEQAMFEEIKISL